MKEEEREDALTVKDIFLHPLGLHHIIQHLLRSFSPHSFVTSSFVGELLLDGVFGVELFEVEERIHPSLKSNMIMRIRLTQMLGCNYVRVCCNERSRRGYDRWRHTA